MFKRQTPSTPHSLAEKRRPRMQAERRRAIVRQHRPNCGTRVGSPRCTYTKINPAVLSAVTPTPARSRLPAWSTHSKHKGEGTNPHVMTACVGAQQTAGEGGCCRLATKHTCGSLPQLGIAPSGRHGEWPVSLVIGGRMSTPIQKLVPSVQVGPAGSTGPQLIVGMGKQARHPPPRRRHETPLHAKLQTIRTQPLAYPDLNRSIAICPM
eukprot:GHVT01005287.1.p2 GENE.GHVT01005287.1~~GHVT01005287.1.p2  ORF type:complete len:209 (+),score=17.61 GHVT01005287.1:1060-1686(+)